MLGEQEFVGELTAGDPAGGAPEGFSCGEAPDGARPPVPTADLLPARARTERAAERGGVSRAESAGPHGGPQPPSPAGGAAEKARAYEEFKRSVSCLPPPAPPPCQARAYEEFKRGQGLELASLLSEHKALTQTPLTLTRTLLP